MVYEIERVRAVNGKIVREKTYLPQGYSGMTKKQQDKSLKKEMGQKIVKKKKKSKKKGLFKGKFLKKPTVKVPSVDPKKFITKGLGHQGLVKEGRTGYFNKEMMEETKWLS